MKSAGEISRFSGGGTQHIDPIKDVRPHQSRRRAPGPPPPRKPDSLFSRWAKRIVYSIFALVIIGLMVWTFGFPPDTRPSAIQNAEATAEARQTAEAQN